MFREATCFNYTNSILPLLTMCWIHRIPETDSLRGEHGGSQGQADGKRQDNSQY